MNQVLIGLLITLLLLVAVLSAGHALIYKRDPRSALGWILACMVIPLVGPLLYWGMGVNRIYRRAKRWQREAGDSVSWPSRVPGPVSFALPAQLSYLSELRTLSDRVVSTALVPGNSIVPLENGEDAYPAMLAAIDGGVSSVHLCTYIFDGDSTGRRFVAALKRAAKRGVEVRVIVDSLGEKYSRPTARKLLKGSGVQFRSFLPLKPGGYLNLRNHRKILVVDGVIAFTGGMNIGDRHLCAVQTPKVKDLHFQVTGPAVADLQRTFLDDWRFAKGEQLIGHRYFPDLPQVGSAMVRAVSDGPDKDFRKLHWIILGAISCARRRVAIVTPYFIPDRALISALATAALRGVMITLVLPGKNNLPYVQWASYAYLWELLQHGVRIFSQPPPLRAHQVHGGGRELEPDRECQHRPEEPQAELRARPRGVRPALRPPAGGPLCRRRGRLPRDHHRRAGRPPAPHQAARRRRQALLPLPVARQTTPFPLNPARSGRPQ